MNTQVKHFVTLRKPSLDDAQELYNVIDTNREHLTNLVWVKDASLESTFQFLQNIREKEEFRLIFLSGRIVGVVTLRDVSERYEIGYWLAYTARGLGVMKEAVKQMVAGRTREIYAHVRVGNIASIEVLLANDFEIHCGENSEWIILLRK